MSLVQQLREAMTRREALAAELAGLDRDLAEVRSLLGLPTEAMEAAVALPVVVPVAIDPHQRTCERCGEPFIWKPGTSGRFCSTPCYAGLPTEERRRRVLKELEAGPAFARDLAGRPALVDTTRSSIHNTLQALRREGLATSSEDGWRLTAKAQTVATTAETDVDEVLAPHLVDAIARLDQGHQEHGVRYEDIVDAPAAPPLLRAKHHDPDRGPVVAGLPERRCGRCMHKFRPTREREYVCPNCIDKPSRIKPDPVPELGDVVFSGGQELIPGDSGMGSSLAGVHDVHGAINREASGRRGRA